MGVFLLALASAALTVCWQSCHPQPARNVPATSIQPRDSSETSFIEEHAKTGFPLLGRHAELPCDACHGAEQPSTDCAACHHSPHGAAFKKKCEDCHAPGIPFATVKFKHPAKDLFALHQEVACIRCHEDRTFLGTSRVCTSCHEDFHKGALGRDCYQCHRSSTWSDVRFNHHQTGFPLMGAHRALECGDCHRDLQSFRIVPRATGCVSCHESDYRSSRFNHAAYGAGFNCQECHLQDTFSYAHNPAWFNIQTGRHAGIACGTCHANSADYKEYSCHACHAGHAGDRNGRCLDCHPGGFPGGD